MHPLVKLSIVLAGVVVVWAQTDTTAAVLGTITDPTGAVVSGASVSLEQVATGQAQSTRSGDLGQYIFVAVQPGLYRLVVAKAGFRQVTVQDLDLVVAKSFQVNVRLDLGESTQTIEVRAGPEVGLQTLDATVGGELDYDLMKALPSVSRCAAGLLMYQPMVAPTRGLAGGMTTMYGGQVAGSRSDQTTFHLDGADASDLTSGTKNYVASAIDYLGPTPAIPVPLESIEEFRISLVNPNATFGRASGGQVSFVTKRGTNTPHGSAYWYYQNDNLNANTWTLNRLRTRRPELKDSRFGATLGGPVLQDRLFLFGHYQGRRFPQTTTVTRLVPTSQLRQGLLRFYDAAGNVNSYRMLDYDPRARGMSPVVSSLWNLLPQGNDTSSGDGLNTIGYTGPADSSVRLDLGIARLDYNLSRDLRFTSTYRYATTGAKAPAQVDIAGLTGGRPGEIRPLGFTPTEPRFFTAQLAGSLRPTLINEATLGYIRNYWAYRRTLPFPQVPGTAAAVMTAQGTLDSGVDVDTPRARGRLWRDNTWQFSDNLTWIKGQHAFQFGGSLRRMSVFREFYDMIVGSLTSLVYELNAATSVGISSAARPPTCGAGVSTNCLRSADVQRWNDLFAAGLGIVDKTGYIATRDAAFNPQPPGTPMRANVTLNAYEVYANDVWRITPGLTLNAGLAWSVQTPYVERDGLQALMVDAGSKEVLDVFSFLGRRRAAAEQGNVHNPTLGWLPIGQSGRKSMFDTDWNNVGPRVSLAWSPSFREGLLGALVGDKRTVIRGGYGAMFSRHQGPRGGTTRTEGPLFAPSLTCNGPRIDGTCPGASTELNAFRIGVDGAAVRMPALGTVRVPEVPGIGAVAIAQLLDPKLTDARTQSVDFTIQRELFGSFLIEVGYAGRWSNDLLQFVEYNSVPLMMRDPASGQTFAQASDAVAQQLRAGTPAAAVTPQPWFENQFRGNARCGSSCTQWLAGARTAAFQQGQLNNLMNFLNAERPGGPIYNRQVSDLWAIASGGRSNYNAGFVSLTRRLTSGLTVTANYTLSKSLDQFGQNDYETGNVSNPYDLDADYGPSLWDATHVFNGHYYYELPFGPGRRFGAHASALGWLTGGWSVSGIVTASSGRPLSVNLNQQAFGGSQLVTSPNYVPGALPVQAGSQSPTSVNYSISGSGGVGAAGNPATGGTGLNLFANPEQVYRGFRPVLVSSDTRHGRGTLRGLSRWNWDVTLAKSMRINEQLRASFSADFLNILNRVEFADPTLSYYSPSSFGVLTSQYGNPRQIQLGLRFDF